MRAMPVLTQVLGDSAPIAAVREQVGRLLRTSTPGRRLPPILVLGETGTGKGLLADSIHAGGGRARGPFVDVNCAAIPETLLESELFGFERGAFTDARQAKAGLFQAASGGTIFLDEVGLLPLGLQAKLLKVIEERSVRRLGSTRSEPIDVSVIAATSEDLAGAVQEGRFRADLYHRLAVVTLVLPPLRARGRDILMLAEEFLGRICEDYRLPTRVLAADAQQALLSYSWPGNVRELANVLERAALLSDTPMLTAAGLGLPGPATEAQRGTATVDAEGAGERRVLLEVLEATGWNYTRAAARLGLPRNTLRYRAERLGLAPEGQPDRRRGGRPPAAARAAAPAPGETVRETRRVTLVQARLSGGATGWEAGRAIEKSASKVRSFGGRIESTGPDALLAMFGLEPDEDAARCAAYAALAVRTLAARERRESTDAPAVTVALHTELLPVTREGEVTQVDAADLEPARAALEALLATAAPGTVVATASASRVLARRFDLSPLEGAGVTAGAALVVRNAESGRTRFVGRERELRLLQECFELTQSGQGQVVMVVGEPGIGKSRLLHEFLRRLGNRATRVEGQALSFGRAMPFHPVIDMIRRVARLDEADPEMVIVEKLERARARLGGDLDDTLPFLRYLLSIDPGDPAVLAMDPRQRHAAIVDATHRLIERGARLRPHVVVLEDLHWCDPATEDWITRLADRIASQRVLIVMTYRPGYRHALGRRSFHTALSLSTLSGEESLQIAGGLLGVEQLPAALQTLVLDKAEGNPFFIEELMRSLDEQGLVRRQGHEVILAAGLERVAVPDTVEDVILDRTHRLSDSLKHVLEVASVIGRTVPFPLLRAVTGRPEPALTDDLRRLLAAGFLYETRLYPEVEYTFKHALTQDVAYSRVKADERRALHARIVDAIEALQRERPDEHVERLAYHATRGELWAQAVRYSRRAGAKAFDRSANREAAASFDEALAALAHLPGNGDTLAEAIDIRLAARSVLLQLAELSRIERYLREAEALATALGDRRRLAWVWTYMTITHLFAGDPARALSVGERALALAEEVGDVGLRATARTPLAHACCELGDYRRAVALYAETIDALQGDLLRERMGQAAPPSVYARSIAAVCLAELGEFGEAERFAGEAATLTRTLDLPFGFVLSHIALGHTALVQGRTAEAMQTLGQALDIIDRRGIPTWFPWAASLHGYALALAGRLDEGCGLLERALERAEALPFLFGHSQWMAWLGHAHALAGRPEPARRRAQEALRLSRERRTRGYEAWALWVLGEIDTQGGAALTQQARVLAMELGMRPLIERCDGGRGRRRPVDAADPSSTPSG
jgi:transcriptional regulator with AAA-type ATPase domain/tetratricopeptide (TPR) repeat protein